MASAMDSFSLGPLQVAIAAFAYLVGSIPFGLILTRASGAGDLRTIGSGNIGATNVLRTGRKGLAALTLLLDGAKGAVPVLLAQTFDPRLAPMAGLLAFLGHCYPIWLRFKGGKGVATALGVLAAIAWPVLLLAAGVWVTTLALSRIVSLSSIVAAIAAPIATYLIGRTDVVPLVAALAIIIVWKHRPNIARLRTGIEPKLGQKAK